MEGSDVRATENKLVLLLDYDKFEFIKVLLKNRAKIVWCTRTHARTHSAHARTHTARTQVHEVASVRDRG
jgi:pre-mRNA-splicing helicase BRR2